MQYWPDLSFLGLLFLLWPGGFPLSSVCLSRGCWACPWLWNGAKLFLRWEGIATIVSRLFRLKPAKMNECEFIFVDRAESRNRKTKKNVCSSCIFRSVISGIFAKNSEIYIFIGSWRIKLNWMTNASCRSHGPIVSGLMPCYVFPVLKQPKINLQPTLHNRVSVKCLQFP